MTLHFCDDPLSIPHSFRTHSSEALQKCSWWWLHMSELRAWLCTWIPSMSVRLQEELILSFKSWCSLQVHCGYCQTTSLEIGSSSCFSPTTRKMLSDTSFVLWWEISSSSQMALRLLLGLIHAHQFIRIETILHVSQYLVLKFDVKNATESASDNILFYFIALWF